MTLVELLESQGHQFKPRGLEQWCECPFHEDTNPSFSVTQSDQGEELWYCFSCKRGGGPADFIAAQDQVSWVAAKRKWDELNGREFAAETTLLDEFVSAVSCNHVPFLLERGIPKEIQDKYGIGYVDSIHQVLALLEVSEQTAKDKGIPLLDRAVIYPFFDAGGVYQVKARLVDEKRYFEQPGPTSRRSLYGLDQVGKVEELFVFEGMNDVLVAAGAGIKAVAMGGTTLYPGHWEELRVRRLQKLVIVPDGDAGGRELLFRLFREGYPAGFCLSVIGLGEGDPDDSISTGEFVKLKKFTLLEWYICTKGVPESGAAFNSFVYDVSHYLSKLDPMQRALEVSVLREYGPQLADVVWTAVEPDLRLERELLEDAASNLDARMAVIALDRGAFHSSRNKSAFDLALLGEAKPVEGHDSEKWQSRLEAVRTLWLREKLLEVIDRARPRLLCEDPLTVVGELTEHIYSVSDASSQARGGSQITRDVMREIERRVKDPRVLGIPLPDRFPVLNRTILGWIPDKYVLVSGNTGHGKTTVVCNFVDDLLYEKEVPVGFISLEMSPSEIVERQLAIRAGVSATKILTGSLEQHEYDRVMQAAKGMLKDRLFIVHRVYDLSRIVGIAKSLVMSKKVRVIVIDYLQLIHCSTRKERWEQLMDISNAIKTQICSEGVTVIAISQLNRSALASDVPEASAQAGSYGVLADVDVALTIRKKKPAEMKKDGSNLLLYVDKHRYNVDQVTIDAMFDRQSLRIYEA